ncbi:MAG: non-heme iron oxygenase ferredoxin subunit [Gammaproteobacteria bacterium]|jgi:3-phenylpropionate/trans-cinnamate dioxygenase ferredoxin subunit|nr:MAG: ferredoxin [Gammaproteobacteria bacterium SG8_31]
MTEENWIDVAAAGDIAPGDYEIAETDEHVVAVFNVDGELYAIEDVCTHDGEELTGGPVEGDQIICPRHGARFCLRSGKALTAPAYEDLPTYPVRIRDGRIQVAVE